MGIRKAKKVTFYNAENQKICEGESFKSGFISKRFSVTGVIKRWFLSRLPYAILSALLICMYKDMIQNVVQHHEV